MTESVWMHDLKQTDNKTASVKRHLQDLIVQGANQNATAILGFIKQQMVCLADLLKSARDLAEAEDTNLSKDVG